MPVVDPHGRSLWYQVHLNSTSEDEKKHYANHPLEVADESSANVIGSMTDKGTHLIGLDIDLGVENGVRVVPSATPGNFHLYIDKELSWDAYKALLHALAAAGVIEEGYLHASLERGQTLLRRTPESKPVVGGTQVQLTGSGIDVEDNLLRTCTICWVPTAHAESHLRWHNFGRQASSVASIEDPF